MLVVYALIDEALPRSEGAPALVSIEISDGVFAAAERVEAAPRLDRASLLSHDAVVRALPSPAVLPARFGSIVDDEAAVREALSPRAPSLREALSLVRGRVQMTLRAFVEPAAPSPAPSPDPALGPGARYLIERRARLFPGAPEIASLLAALAPLVRAERVERSERSEPGPEAGKASALVSVHHLIDREAVDAYVEAARAAPAPPRVSVRGPFPPYAFAEGALP